MAINPLKLLKLKERLGIFKQQHPRVAPFISAVHKDLQVGTILELKVKTPDGQEKVTNIKLTEEDLKTFEMVRELK